VRDALRELTHVLETSASAAASTELIGKSTRVRIAERTRATLPRRDSADDDRYAD
jgi:hypothetical protein